MDKEPDCIFCKIVAGELPCHKIAESELCIAILDAFPVTKGHSLVILKRHSLDYFEMTPEEIEDAALLLKDVAAAIKEAFNAPAINLLSNIGRLAGQVVMHSHLHAIPRYGDDNITITFGGKLEQKDDEKSAILNSIKNCMP